MKIVKINQQSLADINKANQPFEIIGKIKPTFAEFAVFWYLQF